MIVRRFILPLTLAHVASCGPTAGNPTPDSTSTTAGASTGVPTSTGELPTTTDSTGSTSDPAPSTTTDATATSQDSGSFIVPETCSATLDEIDGEWRCTPATCDILAQDCPRGEKCVAWANDGGAEFNDNRCVAVTGPGVAGDPCTAEGSGFSGIDDCALGFLCLDVDAENHGTCAPLCTGTEEMPQCPADLGCMTIEEGIVYVCVPGCEPLVQDCPEGELCLPIDETFLCTPDASGDAGAVNDPCEAADACDEGLTCVGSDVASSACDPRVAGCCQPFCQLPDGACPNPDQVCKPVYEPSPPGHEDVGHCAIP